ncbi:hypothetical protein CORC01_04584 [Colletotrichum orchidophilum]|uniref:Uncharacterized protein n=1 Tax=Colletotrichum orchidophilum TaxID=1209926 RepID=A0A1G4BFP6_9PEZI|nr:uncharacterized protein CORC01_04584 [Colletotrichum orchidophilum]OHF00176.1 hypothetical protein CORC01_04584 [Colletotrichum orchidophilum]
MYVLDKPMLCTESLEAYNEYGVIGRGTRMNQPRRCLVVRATQEGGPRALRNRVMLGRKGRAIRRPGSDLGMAKAMTGANGGGGCDVR